MLRSPQQQRDSLGSGLRGRSSLKAAAIRRGEIKISAPVPLPEQEEIVAIDQPETERVETTQRDTAASEQTRPQATPKNALDEGDTSHKQQKPFEVHTASPSVVRNTHDSSVSRTTTPKIKGGSADMAQSYGTTSPFTSSTIASTPSKSTPIKRRKSASIKDVFRKMLGRKPKAQERSPQSRHGYNQSVRRLGGIKTFSSMLTVATGPWRLHNSHETLQRDTPGVASHQANVVITRTRCRLICAASSPTTISHEHQRAGGHEPTGTAS